MMEELREFAAITRHLPAALGILAKAIFFLPALAVLFVVFFGGIFHRVQPTANYPHWLD